MTSPANDDPAASEQRVSSLLFVNARQVVTCAGPARARRGAEMRDAGIREGVAVLVRDGTIMDVAEEGELRRDNRDAHVIDCASGVLMPGFCDSHTHAIFGRPRYEEQELRAAGAGYMEIAQQGGGIHASVRDLRGRDEEDLFSLASARLRRLAASGVTTVEVKSGYGLTLEDELKTLRVARRLAAELPMRIVPTFLGAHEIPLEYRGDHARREEYIDLLVHEMLPAVADGQLARFADVFCEPGVYTTSEARRILDAARARGLGLKLHADELEAGGGAELAVALGAVSADHLAAVSAAGIAALASSNTVATLLPGTMLFLGKARQAPARALVDAGAAIALATDFNPGTSPTTNYALMLTLGVSQLRMSVGEVLIAATVNGAAALGLAHQVGQIARGFAADIAVHAVDDVRELPYWYGDRRCGRSWTAGKPCHQYDLPVS